jgi:hypothetical protein
MQFNSLTCDSLALLCQITLSIFSKVVIPVGIAGAEDHEVNPGPMYGFTLAIHGTGCPVLGGHDELSDTLTK